MGSDQPALTDAFARAQAVADAILYEGYLLYPYRRSSGKNRVRWQFGVIVPPVWAAAQGMDDTGVAGSVEAAWQQTECLLEAPEGAVVTCRVRFLQIQAKTVEQWNAEGVHRPVDSLDTGSRLEVAFDEAVPCEFDFRFSLKDVLAGAVRFPVEVPGGEEREPVHNDDGSPAGYVVRRRRPLTATVTVSAEHCDTSSPISRLRARVDNTGEGVPVDSPREEALRGSLLACHVLLGTSEGGFLSLLEPPAWARTAAGRCVNVHTFPVLAGIAGDHRVVLSSPILLYDHPRVSPESPGDLHDATEIDEILSLRTLTLTDDEKREARATDPRAAQIVDRTEAMSPDAFARLHGTRRPPQTGRLMVAGVPVEAGSRVLLRPRTHGTDPQDRFLDGRTALVEAVMSDVDGATHVAVTVEDDPAADLNQWYGRFRYFSPDEIEPLPAVSPKAST
jgi:hypothetical protein